MVMNMWPTAVSMRMALENMPDSALWVTRYHSTIRLENSTRKNASATNPGSGHVVIPGVYP